MTTLQEYLNQKYPTKEDKEGVREINISKINEEREKQGITERLEGGELDLSKFVNVEAINTWRKRKNSLKTPLTKLIVGNKPNLTRLDCSGNQLTSIDVSKCPNLTWLDCQYNQLTSIDFLKQLPQPEKLIELKLDNNNIEPTNLEFLRPFINLTEKLTLGNDIKRRYENNIYNRFYGSLEPLRNMTKLYGLCIDGTDIEEGLEYLPTTIKKNHFNCSPKLPNQKVAKIQDQLRPFNYDISAWQLAHPHKMYKAQPHLFELSESREKWLNAVITKIEKTQQKLAETKIQEPDKIKRIKRMELKIDNLSLIKKLLEERSIFEDSLQTGVRWYDKFKEDKATQTDLTLPKINDLEQQQQTIQTKDQQIKELKQKLAQLENQQTITRIENIQINTDN